MRRILTPVTLTRRSVLLWQRVPGALVSRSRQHWTRVAARHLFLRVCRAAPLALALAAAASAQTAGRITGTIKDPDGKPIKGATVRATNEAVNMRMTSTTDDKGR